MADLAAKRIVQVTRPPNDAFRILHITNLRRHDAALIATAHGLIYLDTLRYR